MRNKNTIEFLGTWEILNNPDFKGIEFDTFLNQAGLNRFNMTPQKWIEATNAIGKDSQWLIYAEEADLLNAALWGCTACEWRDANPEYTSKGLNIRDMASINELVVLSNLESFNSELIKLSIPKQKRFKQLQEMAQKQIQQLNTWETERKFRQIDNNTNLIE